MTANAAARAMPTTLPAEHRLVMGGQKSGKSRHAEQLVQHWLQQSDERQAVLLATAQAFDAEMHERIARHQADRRVRVPQMRTVEEPLQIAALVREYSRANTLMLIDCLTLWLTNWLMPMDVVDADEAAGLQLRRQAWATQRNDLVAALRQAPAPVVMVSNDIGAGVIPMGRAVRAFVDEQGLLNQQVAQACAHVTWVVAGCPVAVKGSVAEVSDGF